MSKGFFNFDLRQTVNQWICVTFLGVWCFAIVLYYVVNQA